LVGSFSLFSLGPGTFIVCSSKFVHLKPALEAFLDGIFQLLVRGATRRDAFFLPGSRGLVPSPFDRFNGWMCEFLIERPPKFRSNPTFEHACTCLPMQIFDTSLGGVEMV
jgi:hypothetical protein